MTTQTQAIPARPVTAAPIPPVAPAASAALPHVPPVTATHRPWLAIFSVFAVFIALVGSFILYFLNVSTAARIKEADSSIARLTTQLTTPPLSETDQQAKRLNSSLAGYKAAVAKQLDYSLFLSHLTTVTPKDVTLDSIAIDKNGSVKLAGRAPSYEAAGKAHLAFESSSFLSKVILDSVSFSDKDRLVSFAISATLKKEKLRLPNQSTAQ